MLTLSILPLDVLRVALGAIDRLPYNRHFHRLSRLILRHSHQILGKWGELVGVRCPLVWLSVLHARRLGWYCPLRLHRRLPRLWLICARYLLPGSRTGVGIVGKLAPLWTDCANILLNKVRLGLALWDPVVRPWRAHVDVADCLWGSVVLLGGMRRPWRCRSSFSSYIGCPGSVVGVVVLGGRVGCAGRVLSATGFHELFVLDGCHLVGKTFDFILDGSVVVISNALVVASLLEWIRVLGVIMNSSNIQCFVGLRFC